MGAWVAGLLPPRLMAGYLIHCDGGYVASVLYCELHPHCDDKAKIVMYESETCQTPVGRPDSTSRGFGVLWYVGGRAPDSSR